MSAGLWFPEENFLNQFQLHLSKETSRKSYVFYPPDNVNVTIHFAYEMPADLKWRVWLSEEAKAATAIKSREGPPFGFDGERSNNYMHLELVPGDGQTKVAVR